DASGSGNLGRTPKVPPASGRGCGRCAGNEVSGSARRRHRAPPPSTTEEARMGEQDGEDGGAGASALAPPAWTRAHASTLPASGAWRPRDPSGDRQFLRAFVDRPFVLEGGGQLQDITI